MIRRSVSDELTENMTGEERSPFGAVFDEGRLTSRMNGRGINVRVFFCMFGRCSQCEIMDEEQILKGGFFFVFVL